MDLTIQIDETKFKDVLDKELAAFSDEELHEIVKQALIKYLSDPKVMETIFITTDGGYYGRTQPRASRLLENVVETIDISNECKEITDTFKNAIVNSHKEIISGVIVKAFSRVIAENILADNWLETTINANITAKTYDAIQSQQNH